MYSIHFMLPDKSLGVLMKNGQLILFDLEETAWNIAQDLFKMKIPPKFVWVRKEETASTSSQS